MELYTAFDLHANNSYAAIIDQEGRKVAGKKLIQRSASCFGVSEATPKRYYGYSCGIDIQLVLAGR